MDLTTPLTGKWLELDSGDTGKTTITAGASETYMLKAAGDTSSNDDVVLTFTNTVSGGGDLTVTLKKKI